MTDTVTKSKNVTESRECDDAVTASPRPWCLDDSGTIRDANGCVVVSALNPCGHETRRLIVAAVNDEVSWRDGYIKARTERNAFLAERDSLRDLVRRLARVAQDTLYFAEAISGIIPDNPERAKARSEIEALLREARAAIGKDASP